MERASQPAGRHRRVAIIGAGPIGVEAALRATAAGHAVRVYERGAVGHNVRSWGHVRLFSPWEMNRSRAGLAALAGTGIAPPAGDACPTGSEYVESYLDPLARSSSLGGRILEHHTVVRVGREGIGKSRPSGGERARSAFRLLLETPAGERIERADVVLDCSGTYGNPNWMGNGNVPAPGERALAGRVDYTLRDIAGAERERFSGRRVLLVGGGQSAATALEALCGLPGARVVWLLRSTLPRPYPVLEDDPLPERSRLARMANELAAGADPRVECRRGAAVERLCARGVGFEVELSVDGGHETIAVDRILAHVGYRPDRSIYRELQVHECFASLGPMRLAATLLASGAADCLAQPVAEAEALATPEPDFFILGAKSYGMNPSFLIRTGIEQARRVCALIDAGDGSEPHRRGRTAAAEEDRPCPNR